MNPQIPHSSNFINQPNSPSKSNSQMIDQHLQESNHFTQRQIQIIRSYIGELNLLQQQQKSDFTLLAQKIQKQTQLQTKSAKQIQEMIYKLLYPQSAGEQQKIQQQNIINSSRLSSTSEKKQEIMHSPPQKTVQHQQKISGLENQNEEGIFQTKSLFKSFTDPLENSGFKQSALLGFSDNGFQGIRKVNLFTKPSIELVKSTSSGNGFISLMENNSLGQQPKQTIQAQNHNEIVDFPSFSKKATKQFRQSSQTYQYKSRRKIRPLAPLQIDPLLTPQQKIEWIETNTNDCHTILQKKLIKKTLGVSKESYYVNEKLSGIFNEYFYSNYDKAYFSQQNQFTKLVNYLGLDSKRINFKQFKLIKKALPQTKLFNVQFVISQQNKLNQFRSQLRQIPKQRAKSEDIQLVVGRQVTALHPVCGHLHSGTILAIYKQNQYMVKFTRPQLGTQKVLDINISTRSLSGTNKAAIQNLDYESMVMVIKLLEYKGDLLQKFKQYNDYIEELKQNDKQFDNQLLQEYGWLGSAINILSMGLRHIMAKFRIRGLNQTNQQLVGKNFSSLLINPLNLMSKQLQNSSQMSDIQTSNQIKKMASNRSNSRIEQCLKCLSMRNNHYVEESEMNPEQKQNVSQLIKNVMGMLLNFRFEGRNFSIQSNKYLHNIQKLIDNEYTEQFNQIYSNVHSIVKRINDTQ